MVETGIVVGCALAVVASGYLKVLRPGDAGAAIDAARVPLLSGWIPAARLVGGVEVVVGLAVVATGHEAATTALSVLYVGFAVFVLRLRETAPGAGCGCIGAAGRPPGLAHLVVCANAAIVCSPMVATFADPLVDLDPGSMAVAGSVAVVVALAVLLVPTVGRRPRL